MKRSSITKGLTVQLRPSGAGSRDVRDFEEVAVATVVEPHWEKRGGREEITDAYGNTRTVHGQTSRYGMSYVLVAVTSKLARCDHTDTFREVDDIRAVLPRDILRVWDANTKAEVLQQRQTKRDAQAAAKQARQDAVNQRRQDAENAKAYLDGIVGAGLLPHWAQTVETLPDHSGVSGEDGKIRLTDLASIARAAFDAGCAAQHAEVDHSG